VVADLGATSKAVWDSVIGYGPLQQYFDDPSIEEIWVNDRLTAGSGSSAPSSQRSMVDGRGACFFAGVGKSGLGRRPV
jgi:Flp pilus assembly CpaF family ATPase